MPATKKEKSHNGIKLNYIFFGWHFVALHLSAETKYSADNKITEAFQHRQIRENDNSRAPAEMDHFPNENHLNVFLLAIAQFDERGP